MKIKNILLLIIFSTCFALQTNSLATTYYEENNEQIISNGAILHQITKYTDSGIINLNIVELDLLNKNIKIDMLYSKKGTSYLTSTNEMAKQSNAIVSLNGDYFAKRPNVTNRGQSIGLSISNNNIITSAANENNSENQMATFSIQNNDLPVFSYFKNEINITSPKTNESFTLCEINKYLMADYINILTPAWGTMSIGNSEGRNLLELVVINNIVTEVRQGLEPIVIPENGYILACYGQPGMDFLLNNFSVGDSVTYTTNIDLNSINFAISGGTLLVKNGVIPKFSHIVWGNNEMSAIGTSKDNNTVYLIACTKINNKTLGITQSDFASTILEYGIYNALCLDGGGSTTLVAKKPEDTSYSTIFSESSYLRPVINSIGVFNITQPTNILKDFTIEFNKDMIFKNNSTSFTLKGFDTNYYPMQIEDLSKVTVSFNNNCAKYANGQILGISEGIVDVTFKYDNISKTKSLKILGEVSSLIITPESSMILKNEKQNFSFLGIDSLGNKAPIDSSLVKLNYLTNNSSIQNNTFYGNKIGQYLISASIDNVYSYSNILVTDKQKIIIDDFEILKGSYNSYPNTITGNAELTAITSLNDKSLKLSFNFSNPPQAIRGGYYDYASYLQLPDKLLELGVWIYNPVKNSNSIKSQYLDANGNKQIEILTDKMDWTGWKYLTYKSLNKIKSIVSIYVAQHNISIVDNGYIIIDNLTATTYLNLQQNVSIPDNTSLDIYNKSLNNSYCISFIETMQKPKIMFDILKNNNIINNLNKNSNSVLFTLAEPNDDILSNLKIEYNNYTSYEKKNILNTTLLYINKDNLSNDSFWKKFENDLISSEKKLIIVLSSSINDFNKIYQKDLFDKLLSNEKEKNKTCWIIQNGATTDVQNINGIKIFTLGNLFLDYSNLENVINNYKYLNIYIDQDNLYYDFKPAIQKITNKND